MPFILSFVTTTLLVTGEALARFVPIAPWTKLDICGIVLRTNLDISVAMVFSW